MAPPTRPKWSDALVMTPDKIATKLQERFGDRIAECLPDDKHPRVHVDAEHWREIAEVLRHDPELQFDWLSCITGVDYLADHKLCAVYDLRSTVHGHTFAVKVYVDRAAPSIRSVADLWPAADWHEREAYDLVGIVFEGHPDFRRILLPDDWVGHPLRKDYEPPSEYHGIPNMPEAAQQQGE